MIHEARAQRPLHLIRPGGIGALTMSALTLMAIQPVQAQVPAELKQRIVEIGTTIDPPTTAALYRPQHPTPPYAGVSVARDISYGPHSRNVLDVFSPREKAPPRAVLIFVPGGAGNKIEPVPGGGAFYDNVVLWAAKKGMIGVNMQRHLEFAPWNLGARDIAQVIDWVHKNIGAYGGDPRRVFIWGHSAGARNLSVYLSHPDLYPGGQVGVKGAVLMAGPYDLTPLTVQAEPLRLRLTPGGPIVGVGDLAGSPPPQPLAGDPSDPVNGAILPGLKSLSIPLLVGVAEFDPPAMIESARILREQLCSVGKCPRYQMFKDHGHMSAVFAVNTADASTSGPVLEFIRSIR
jgi:triacylglycerol lipase